MSYTPTTPLAKAALATAPSCISAWSFECGRANASQYPQCAKLSEWERQDPEAYDQWFNETPYCSQHDYLKNGLFITGIALGVGIAVGILL